MNASRETFFFSFKHCILNEKKSTKGNFVSVSKVPKQTVITSCFLVLLKLHTEKKKEKKEKEPAINDALYSGIREHNALQSHPFAQLMNILI